MTATGSGTTAEEAGVITIAFIVAWDVLPIRANPCGKQGVLETIQASSDPKRANPVRKRKPGSGFADWRPHQMYYQNGAAAPERCLRQPL